MSAELPLLPKGLITVEAVLKKTQFSALKPEPEDEFIPKVFTHFRTSKTLHNQVLEICAVNGTTLSAFLRGCMEALVHYRTTAPPMETPETK